MNVSLHALTLVLPLAGTSQELSQAWRCLPATPPDRVHSYFTADVAERLYAHRVELVDRPTVDVQVGGDPGGPSVNWAVTRAELARMAGVDVLALGLVAPGPIRLADLQASVDQLRMLRPYWSGQVLPRWGGREPGLAAWLESVLPGARPVMDDPRAFGWVLCALASDTDLDVVYALAQHDPPGMAAPPSDVRDDFLRRQGWRRWEAAGTFHAFTHYGGATVHFAGQAGTPPDWMVDVHTGLYFDLAVWVARVVAAREQAVRQLVDTPPGAVCGLWQALDSEWEMPRISEQDQGRRLARAWLDAVEADHGHRARLRTWAGQ